MRRAEARRSASMMISNSIRWSLAGNDVDWMTNTSAPRTFSWISAKISMSAKRRPTALGRGVPRCLPMAAASIGLELPATSLIAPLLPAIPALLRAPHEHDPETWMPVFGKDHARTENKVLIQAALGTGNMNRGLSPLVFPLQSQGFRCRGGEDSEERDGVDVAAVIRLGAVRHAAIAEKTRRIGIGAQAEILGMADASPRQPRCDIAAKIEQGMARPRTRGEKPVAGAVFSGKARDEIGADLVIGLPDHGPDGGPDLT